MNSLTIITIIVFILAITLSVLSFHYELKAGKEFESTTEGTNGLNYYTEKSALTDLFSLVLQLTGLIMLIILIATT